MATTRKDSQKTRRQLIDAAEALFADKGIDNVSLVDISRAALQKNRNALQYHFGDKEGLINAVLDKHSEGIAEERHQRLDELERAATFTLRDVVEVLVVPLAAKLADEEGMAYLKINSQLMASDHYAGLRLQRASQIPEARRLEQVTARKMPRLARPVMLARMLLVDTMLFNGLAAFASRFSRRDRRVFINTLIDSITAVLSQD